MPGGQKEAGKGNFRTHWTTPAVSSTVTRAVSNIHVTFVQPTGHSAGGDVRIAILSPYPTFPFQCELGCRTISYENNATWTVALADALALLPDTTVHVLTECTEVPRTQTLSQRNVTLHFIKAPEQFKTLTLWHFDRRRMHTVLADIGPDIVHGQGIENQYGDAAVRSSYPHLLTVHGIPRLSNLALGSPRFSRVRITEYTGNLCLKAARNIVVINQFVAEHLHLDPARHRLFHIPNAVGEHFFADAPVERESNLILSIGWIDRLKAHDILARALALLRHRGVDTHAKVVGPIPPSSYFDSLRCYAHDEKIDLEFTDFLPPGQVAGWLRRCTVLVHPSRHENAPMSICEAMACGTPVIAARVGGVSCLIRDGETGMLFESANAAELADKLETLLTDPDLRRRLGENARRYAQENFRPAVIAQKTRAAYENVLAGNGQG